MLLGVDAQKRLHPERIASLLEIPVVAAVLSSVKLSKCYQPGILRRLQVLEDCGYSYKKTARKYLALPGSADDWQNENTS